MQPCFMKRATKVIVYIFILQIIFVTSVCSSELANLSGESTPLPGANIPLKMIEPGSDAPDFTIKDLNDKDFKLSDAIGKKVVFLLFWSIFCQPCQEEIPVIKEMYDKVGKDKITVLAVSLDGDRRVPAIEKYIEKNKLDFTFLMDVFDDETSGFVASDIYGVMGTPSFFIIDKSGVVTYSHTGKSSLEDLMKNVFDAKP